MTENRITEEERKKAEKILSGLTWVGDKEEMIENIVKKQIRKKGIRYYG
jgi:hypothetical protein